MKTKIALLGSLLLLGVAIPSFAAESAVKDVATEKAKQPPEWAGLLGDRPRVSQ